MLYIHEIARMLSQARWTSPTVSHFAS